jgi:hypothetical protein
MMSTSKVIGYFSYTTRNIVFCDGDACIIAASESLMKSYLQALSDSDEKDLIKKTRFGEIMNGLMQGAAYAFDEESYKRFLDIAKINDIGGLPEAGVSSGLKSTPHFIRIQLATQ